MLIDRGVAGAAALDLVGELMVGQRTITGEGLRSTLDLLGRSAGGLDVLEYRSGSEVLDWIVPPEWRLRSARLTDPGGRVLADAAEDPLAVVAYSVAFEGNVELDDLLAHLHSAPHRPEAVPYRTSYYQRTWGFCLPHRVLESLADGRYDVSIDSELDDSGSLSVGEARRGPGATAEIVLSAHVCHAGQANDNASGTAVLATVARHLAAHPPPVPVTCLFLPGGIGSIAWLSDHTPPEVMLSLGCVGDPAPLAFKATKTGDTTLDRAVRVAARDGGIELGHYPWSPYGFDDRNFSSPGIDVPAGSLSRSPHGGYPEYHTSDDNLDLMEAGRLGETVELVLRTVDVLARSRSLRRTEPRGEPQLGRRGLYGSIGGLTRRPDREMALLWVSALADGDTDLAAMAERSGLAFDTIADAAAALVEAGVLESGT